MQVQSGIQGRELHTGAAVSYSLDFCLFCLRTWILIRSSSSSTVNVPSGTIGLDTRSITEFTAVSSREMRVVLPTAKIPAVGTLKPPVCAHAIRSMFRSPELLDVSLERHRG